jgi:phage-related protein
MEAILQAQPTIKIKSYEQTTITITMPKLRYERMGRPQVGEVLEINISKK